MTAARPFAPALALAAALAMAAALALAAALWPEPARAATDAPCIATVSAQPSRPVTGQQVLYRLRILRRPEVAAVRLAAPLAFPDLHSVWLPGRAEESKVVRDGETYLVREEHRALFPARAGQHRLPAFQLACELGTGTVSLVPIPAIPLVVTDPPAAGRPADWSGVIGPLRVQVLADATEVALGESVRLSVLVRGAGNLWVLDEPLAGPTLGTAEIFHRPAELDTGAGERLRVRRFFRMDIVPHAAGTLEVPALSLPYYDPDLGRYRAATTEPVTIHVRPRPDGLPTARSAPGPRPRAEQRATGGATDALPGRDFTVAAALALTAAAMLAAGLAAVRFGRSRSGVRQRWRAVTRALGEAAEARERGDPTREASCLATALRTAARLANSPGGGGEHPSVEAVEAVEAMLESLERTRYARDAEPADRAAIVGLIERLHRRSATGGASPSSHR